MTDVNAQGLLWSEDVGQNLLSALLNEFPANDREVVSVEVFDKAICDFVKDFYDVEITLRQEPVFSYLYYILFYGVLQTFMQFHGFSKDRRKTFMTYYSNVILMSMNKNLEQQYGFVKGKNS